MLQVTGKMTFTANAGDVQNLLLCDSGVGQHRQAVASVVVDLLSLIRLLPANCRRADFHWPLRYICFVGMASALSPGVFGAHDVALRLKPDKKAFPVKNRVSGKYLHRVSHLSTRTESIAFKLLHYVEWLVS